MRPTLTIWMLALLLVSPAAFAQDGPLGTAPEAALSGDVDLILPATLASADAPFYREAKVKIGDAVLPVTEAALPSGTLAEYQPQQNRVVVSNSATASETAKGQALLDVVTALQASAITTAAGGGE